MVDLPTPKPGAGQVLVRIEASGVNFIDTYLREGRYPAELPFIPGQEAAGLWWRLGEGVSGFRGGRSRGVDMERGARMPSLPCAPAERFAECAAMG